MSSKKISKTIVYKKFSEINIEDEFFDSLREDYEGFNNWFIKKQNDYAYIHYNNNNKIDGFLYLKIEQGIIENSIINEEFNKIIKIGTFKINPHGTKLGERFIKLALDFMVENDAEICYVTIFDKHKSLIELLTRYGFIKEGYKTDNNDEGIYIKYLNRIKEDIYLDYPLVNIKNKNIYLLSVYPKYHSNLFPDSLLKTENPNILNDLSYTNSIHKVYVCAMNGAKNLKYGDILLIYRTKEEGKSAKYSAVVTGVCVVEEIRLKQEFSDFNEFYNYASSYSIFDRDDLQYWFNKKDIVAIKLTYNIALKKRIIRDKLINEIGLPKWDYFGFLKVSSSQFLDIIEKGEINSKIILK